MFCQEVSNILNVGRLHKTLAKNPIVRLWTSFASVWERYILKKGGVKDNAGESTRTCAGYVSLYIFVKWD
jgi:hypothetical protein